MGWLLLGLAGAGAYLYSLITGDTQLGLLAKGIPVIALLFWLRQTKPGVYRRWISLGLLFSLAGDLLLAWPGDLFVQGLSAFLFAHLAYLRAYLHNTRHPALLALLPALLIGGGMFAVLANAGLGQLLMPVACYVTAISLMFWRALAQLGHPRLQPRSTWLAAGGAALFVLSDSLIGIDRFLVSFDAAPYAIIVTYWLGQWGITASAFSRSNSA
ncbi:Membrane protein [Pseudomonas sp. 8Z]|uniref:lysoplasmalogenase n=1 Tax=Pseudomonas sp. 8Z TaxID=2653166 RepID=UPI0012F32419|nr:lysoplasmalogenase [Pseudomonas sp. 8Z]VXC52702.1 Membrane protein [Pseudomonas sp. 8Z]